MSPYCAACGQPILPGDVAYHDPDDTTTLYCSGECFADDHATTVIVDEPEHLPYHGGPTWTYDEAVRLARIYDRLCRELDEVERICRAAAQTLEADGNGAAAVAYRRAAELIDEARRAAAWGEVRARCGS